MTESAAPSIFDGHNDLLARLWGRSAGERVAAFMQGDGTGQLDLPRMRAGGFGGGFFAIWTASGPLVDMDAAMRAPSYSVPLPAAMTQAEALPAALGMAGLLRQLERESGGALSVCTTAAAIEAAMAAGSVAAVMHIEGAECIDADLTALEAFYAAGLRSLGPVWSRPNIFGHGVPFRYPSGPDTGPGLTVAGRALVRACDEMRIMLDLSHLNEEGFWDVAEFSDMPLVATHSNAAAICASSRNLTDRQLHAIRERGGMVGVNFAVAFLRPDGRRDRNTGYDVMLRHIDHLIAQLGEDKVGLGSDFDGATIPAQMGDVVGLNGLRDAMRAHGYNDDLMRRLCHQNWIELLRKVWGA